MNLQSGRFGGNFEWELNMELPIQSRDFSFYIQPPFLWSEFKPLYHVMVDITLSIMETQKDIESGFR